MFNDPSGVSPVLAPKKPRRDASTARLKAMARSLTLSRTTWEEDANTGRRYPVMELLRGLARKSLNSDGFAELKSLIEEQFP